MNKKPKLIRWQKSLTKDQREPADVLEDFVQAWADRDFVTMIAKSQISWIDLIERSYESVVEKLDSMFNAKPIKIRFVEHEFVSNVAFRVVTVVTVQIARGIEKSLSRDVRVICEEGPLNPSPEGKWGVNPQSIQV